MSSFHSKVTFLVAAAQVVAIAAELRNCSDDECSDIKDPEHQCSPSAGDSCYFHTGDTGCSEDPISSCQDAGNNATCLFPGYKFTCSWNNQTSKCSPSGGETCDGKKSPACLPEDGCYLHAGTGCSKDPVNKCSEAGNRATCIDFGCNWANETCSKKDAGNNIPTNRVGVSIEICNAEC